MQPTILQTLAIVAVLGIGAQWLAWRLRLPSILLLLTCGFLAGPVFGWVDPDALLGDLLMPIVSLSVALILFEGGMTLKFTELTHIAKVVRNLITVGALVTWVATSLAAWLLLKWDFSLATLLGAILVVTGPTVIMPLLRHVQPARQIGSTLKWEGILIDPIGALLALLVFEAILSKELQAATLYAALGFVKTMVVGGALGAFGATLLIVLFRRHWVPDFLQNPVALMAVVALYTLSNTIQHESGLLTVTLMGIVLANRRGVAIRHIVEFKENLRVLLIAALFILLAARLEYSDFSTLNWPATVGFLLVLFFLVRPAAVAVSAMGSPMTWKERVFLSWMAPRGIVAAAVASIFALRLEQAGYTQASDLVPMTFLVIVSTVALYGLTASPLARKLGLSNPNPQGVLIVGADPLAREIARVVKDSGFQVLLIDTNRENVAAARMENLPIYYGSILSEHVREELELSGIGRLLALTPNPEVNALAAMHFVEFFGRSEVFQVVPPVDRSKRNETVSREMTGRLLFGKTVTFSQLAGRFAGRAVIKKTSLTEEFDFAEFRALYGEEAIPMFLITESKQLKIITVDHPPSPEPGQTLISLVVPRDEDEDDDSNARSDRGATEGRSQSLMNPRQMEGRAP